MLYKKYHRNFVKQFRIGTRVKFNFVGGKEYQIRQNPFICKGSQGNVIEVYYGKSRNYDLCLVFANGKLVDEIEVL